MKYPTKEIFILTDGETETDWDEWKSTVRKLTGQGISLKVVSVTLSPLHASQRT